MENAAELDPILREGLLALQKRHPLQAGCVQSRGLVAGIQIVKPGTREPDPEAALAVNEKCFHKGLLMFAPVGVAGECIKIAPALDISREALEEGIQTLGEAMDEVLAGTAPRPMTKGFQTLVVGGGMITADLLLPCLYHLQRRCAIGEITVCSLSTGPLRALADNREIREAFPDRSFISQPPLSEPPEADPPGAL